MYHLKPPPWVQYAKYSETVALPFRNVCWVKHPAVVACCFFGQLNKWNLYILMCNGGHKWSRFTARGRSRRRHWLSFIFNTTLPFCRQPTWQCIHRTKFAWYLEPWEKAHPRKRMNSNAQNYHRFQRRCVRRDVGAVSVLLETPKSSSLLHTPPTSCFVQ